MRVPRCEDPDARTWARGCGLGHADSGTWTRRWMRSRVRGSRRGSRAGRRELGARPRDRRVTEAAGPSRASDGARLKAEARSNPRPSHRLQQPFGRRITGATVESLGRPGTGSTVQDRARGAAFHRRSQGRGSWHRLARSACPTAPLRSMEWSSGGDHTWVAWPASGLVSGNAPDRHRARHDRTRPGTPHGSFPPARYPARLPCVSVYAFEAPGFGKVPPRHHPDDWATSRGAHSLARLRGRDNHRVSSLPPTLSSVR